MTTTPSAWLTQQLNKMARGIADGKTRRRKVQSTKVVNVTETMIKEEVRKRGWKVAQIGDDYVFAPSAYSIRPIV